MKLIVNGQEHDHTGDGSVRALLTELAADPNRVALMVNDDTLPRQVWDATRLKAHDRVEILTFMGGG